jgi:hypothetical protein
MIRAKNQLKDESRYPHLASFLRSSGTVEVGEDFSTGAFARLRKGTNAFVVAAKYGDLAAVLKEMDSQAKRCMEDES